MVSLSRLRIFVAAMLIAMVGIALPDMASAKPIPGPRRTGFRLFAKTLGALSVNRVACGLDASKGNICTDSTNSGTVGGGFWPKGTANQYVFNSGLQVAGIIGGDPLTNPWAGDTVGSFFFDPKGQTEHGQEVAPVFNTQNAFDRDTMNAAADARALASLVPDQADPNVIDPVTHQPAQIFNELLRGRAAASQGDVWFLTWEGDPALSNGRAHPMGVLVESRGMGWNFPVGNQDIIYFVYTFYNVTSLNEADYAAVRPGMREILLQKAQEFHAKNNALLPGGQTLPTGGYPINNFFAAFGADMDVGNATSNYASVNLPFALGYTYQNDFGTATGFTFDPKIFGGAFFPGVGFVGVKYLRSPSGPGEIQLFSNTIRQPPFSPNLPDPENDRQLYRYLSGSLAPPADQPCNFGNPLVTHICYINNTQAFDMRFYQSSSPATLAPGGFGTIVVAYIFAAPVTTPGFTPGGSTDLLPGNPLRFSTLDSLQNPLGRRFNTVDSITGLRSFVGDVNGNGVPDQTEFRVVENSLLGKALRAQAVFDNKFLLPFAPESPNFYLVPGNNSVTVLWQPSPSEVDGDPFFAIATAPTTLDGEGNVVPNALYDPNYREKDVEGYRIYRGRVDDPNSLQLVAQFDYGGAEDVIRDYAGQVNPADNCAPELGLNTVCVNTAGDTIIFSPIVAGQARTVFNEIPLVGDIRQVQFGQRVLLASGLSLSLAADTTVSGGATNGSCAPAVCPPLSDTGVPFIYTDHGPRNGFRYFYSVVAFDINSFQSGPSSLESARTTKAVTPISQPTNEDTLAVSSVEIFGRDVNQTAAIADPTFDATSGRFSGPARPGNGTSLGLTEFVKAILPPTGGFEATLDSVVGGVVDINPYASFGVPSDPALTTFYYTAQTPAGEVQVSSVIQIDGAGFTRSTAPIPFNAFPVDPTQAAKYGINPNQEVQANVGSRIPGAAYTTNQALMCAVFGPAEGEASEPFDVDGNCFSNGPRWFNGPSPANNETKVAPTDPTTNNGGELTGVTNIYLPHAYASIGSQWRNVEWLMAPRFRSTDYNVYWGAGGLIDSVIDVSNNVVVPFGTTAEHNWGVLTQAGSSAPGGFDTRPGVLTVADFSCVEPMRSNGQAAAVGPPAVAALGVQGRMPCTSAAPYALTTTATLGPIAYSTGQPPALQTDAAAAEQGFAFYVGGTITLFQMTGNALPADGTVWALRTYSGVVNGDGESGYNFTPRENPWIAAGTTAKFGFQVSNGVGVATKKSLDNVHTVPDPYYITSRFERTADGKIIKFVNLPAAYIIRIYTSSGVLVRVLESGQDASCGPASCDWDVRNRNRQFVASGVYFYHVESGDARKVGRFTVVNFAR